MQALPPMIDVAFVPAVAGTPPWLADVLDAAERARWATLREAGRPLFLAAHAGVRMLAARRLAWASDPPQPAPELSAFAWHLLPSGKPTLTFRDGRSLPLHVSVSHAGGVALVAVSDHGPIGVDVEHLDARRSLLPIARRFFSADEHDHLAGCGLDERTAVFHQWWTRKEAVLKATGAGLRGGLAVRVDAPPDAHGWRRVELDGHPAPLFVRDVHGPDPGAVAAVAVEGQPAALQPVSIRFEALGTVEDPDPA